MKKLKSKIIKKITKIVWNFKIWNFRFKKLELAVRHSSALRRHNSSSGTHTLLLCSPFFLLSPSLCLIRHKKGGGWRKSFVLFHNTHTYVSSNLTMYNNQPPNYNQPPVVQYIQPAPVMYAPPVEMVAPPMGDPLIDGLSYFPALVVKQKTNSFWEYLCNCEEENVSFKSLLYLVFLSLFAPSPSIVYCPLFRFIISFDLCKKYTIFNPMGDNKESMNPSRFIIVPYPTCFSFLHFLSLSLSLLTFSIISFVLLLSFHRNLGGQGEVKLLYAYVPCWEASLSHGNQN